MKIVVICWLHIPNGHDSQPQYEMHQWPANVPNGHNPGSTMFFNGVLQHPQFNIPWNRDPWPDPRSPLYGYVRWSNPEAPPSG